ncbi:MAG: heme ABC exporter ATP-binding protein CcmA [Lysobacteraceae bacterium]
MTHAPSPPLLTARGLGFHRNDSRVFGSVDFHVGAGEALLVTGGNGAGKTTLLRVVAGLLSLSEGEVRFRGAPVVRGMGAPGMAFLGHHAGHKGDLTALENLDFATGIGGCRAGIDAEAALVRVGLAGHEDSLAGKLSAGQRKRLGLARLLLVPADLWLLDEPYANLDLGGIELVNRLIGDHVAAGGAALVTTHGAYAAPPVRTRTLVLGDPARVPAGATA